VVRQIFGDKILQYKLYSSELAILPSRISLTSFQVTEEKIDVNWGVGMVGAFVNSILHNCPNSCGQVFADFIGFNVIVAGDVTCEKSTVSPVHGSGPKID
jgi:hypothetical protein